MSESSSKKSFPCGPRGHSNSLSISSSINHASSFPDEEEQSDGFEKRIQMVDEKSQNIWPGQWHTFNRVPSASLNTINKTDKYVDSVIMNPEISQPSEINDIEETFLDNIIKDTKTTNNNSTFGTKKKTNFSPEVDIVKQEIKLLSERIRNLASENMNLKTKENEYFEKIRASTPDKIIEMITPVRIPTGHRFARKKMKKSNSTYANYFELTKGSMQQTKNKPRGSNMSLVKSILLSAGTPAGKISRAERIIHKLEMDLDEYKFKVSALENQNSRLWRKNKEQDRLIKMLSKRYEEADKLEKALKISEEGRMQLEEFIEGVQLHILEASANQNEIGTLEGTKRKCKKKVRKKEGNVLKGTCTRRVKKRAFLYEQ